MSFNPSITLYERTEDLNLQIGRGLIEGHSLVNVQGFNAAQPTGFRAVWERSALSDYVYPVTSVPMSFSSSLNETLTMVVSGLDDTYSLKSATVQFNASTTGTVIVGTSTFFRINSMRIIKGVALDTVVATNNGNYYAQINPGTGNSQASIYTVPLGYTFYLTRAQAFTTNNGTQYCTYRVYSQNYVAGVLTNSTVLSAPFNSSYSSTRIVPRGYEEKTDIQWQLSQSNSAPGSIQVEGILIKNT